MAKSTRPMVRIHDLSTDEVIDREMNDAEFAQYQEQQTALATELAEAESKVAAKAALLTRLGITAEEAALLLS